MNKKTRILVVDDEEDILESLETYFTRKGLDVSTAENGKEALGLYEKGKYDVILTDIRMPEKDGIELLREIKSQDPG